MRPERDIENGRLIEISDWVSGRGIRALKSQYLRILP